MKDTTHRRWDVIIKIITSITGVVIILIGLKQYTTNNYRNYRSELYREQFRFYEEILTITGELSVLPYDSLISDTFPKAKKDFIKYYHGKLILVESSLVEYQMHQLMLALQEMEKEDEKKIQTKQTDIQDLCTQLALACRKSLSDTWAIQLEELERLQPNQKPVK